MTNPQRSPGMPPVPPPPPNRPSPTTPAPRTTSRLPTAQPKPVISEPIPEEPEEKTTIGDRTVLIKPALDVRDEVEETISLDQSPAQKPSTKLKERRITLAQVLDLSIEEREKLTKYFVDPILLDINDLTDEEIENLAAQLMTLPRSWLNRLAEPKLRKIGHAFNMAIKAGEVNRDALANMKTVAVTTNIVKDERKKLGLTLPEKPSPKTLLGDDETLDVEEAPKAQRFITVAPAKKINKPAPIPVKKPAEVPKDALVSNLDLHEKIELMKLQLEIMQRDLQAGNSSAPEAKPAHDSDSSDEYKTFVYETNTAPEEDDKTMKLDSGMMETIKIKPEPVIPEGLKNTMVVPRIKKEVAPNRVRLGEASPVVIDLFDTESQLLSDALITLIDEGCIAKACAPLNAIKDVKTPDTEQGKYLSRYLIVRNLLRMVPRIQEQAKNAVGNVLIEKFKELATDAKEDGLQIVVERKERGEDGNPKTVKKRDSTEDLYAYIHNEILPRLLGFSLVETSMKAALYKNIQDIENDIRDGVFDDTFKKLPQNLVNGFETTSWELPILSEDEIKRVERAVVQSRESNVENLDDLLNLMSNSPKTAKSAKTVRESQRLSTSINLYFDKNAVYEREMNRQKELSSQLDASSDEDRMAALAKVREFSTKFVIDMSQIGMLMGQLISSLLYASLPEKPKGKPAPHNPIEQEPFIEAETPEEWLKGVVDREGGLREVLRVKKIFVLTKLPKQA